MSALGQGRYIFLEFEKHYCYLPAYLLTWQVSDRQAADESSADADDDVTDRPTMPQRPIINRSAASQQRCVMVVSGARLFPAILLVTRVCVQTVHCWATCSRMLIKKKFKRLNVSQICVTLSGTPRLENNTHVYVRFIRLFCKRSHYIALMLARELQAISDPYSQAPCL